MDRNQAYQAYKQAEDQWQSALEASFGKDAGDARYDTRGMGPEGSRLRKLYDAYMRANMAWHRIRDADFAAAAATA